MNCMLRDEQVQEIWDGSFPGWITGLWGSICYFTELKNVAECKSILFFILEKWLREGKVMFCAPDADVYIRPDYKPKYTINDPEAQWHAAPEEIIAWLKERWPKDVTDINDVRLIHYFFDIPGIIWVDQETGKLYGS